MLLKRLVENRFRVESCIERNSEQRKILILCILDAFFDFVDAIGVYEIIKVFIEAAVQRLRKIPGRNVQFPGKILHGK